MTNNIINITFHIEIVMFDTFHHRFLPSGLLETTEDWYYGLVTSQEGPWNILFEPFLSL